MAKEKQNRLGKPLAQIGGLRLRLTPNGEYGIYAGKHLFKSYLLIDSALKDMRWIHEDKPTHYALCKTYKEWKTKNK